MSQHRESRWTGYITINCVCGKYVAFHTKNELVVKARNLCECGREWSGRVSWRVT